MAVFYVLHIRERDLSDCLDAIRFLCDPSQKQRAHITLRGPYTKKIDVKAINQKVSGRIVSVDGVGNFFSAHQNTVFFNCSGPALKDVWHKSDFPFNPHLTIYDGPSSEFAHRLYQLISMFRYGFRFRAEELDAIESKKGQSSLTLAISFNSQIVQKVVGERVLAAEVPGLTNEKRLALIQRLCEYLAKIHRGGRKQNHPEQSQLQFAAQNSISN